MPLLAKRLGIVTKSVRCMAYWNKDWKPGPYPHTPKERAAAAKKYNMRVEDYEPYPDDGFGYGDYPKLPRIADEAKDPYQPYDLPNNRRFFGEPVHVDAECNDRRQVESYKNVQIYDESAEAMVSSSDGWILGCLFARLEVHNLQPSVAKALLQ